MASRLPQPHRVQLKQAAPSPHGGRSHCGQWPAYLRAKPMLKISFATQGKNIPLHVKVKPREFPMAFFQSIKLWSWRKHGANRICTVARLPRTEGTKPWLCNEFHEGTSLFLHLSHLCIPHHLLLHLLLLLQSGTRCIDDKYSPSRRASNWSDSFWFHPEKGKQSEEQKHILMHFVIHSGSVLPSCFRSESLAWICTMSLCEHTLKYIKILHLLNTVE